MPNPYDSIGDARAHIAASRPIPCSAVPGLSTPVAMYWARSPFNGILVERYGPCVEVWELPRAAHCCAYIGAEDLLPHICDLLDPPRSPRVDAVLLHRSVYPELPADPDVRALVALSPPADWRRPLFERYVRCQMP